MKFIAVLASLIAAASAQNTAIGYPPDQTTVSPGQNMTVQVNRPNSLTGSQEVAVVIAVGHCYATPCDNTERLGTILYNGPFKPEYPTTHTPQDTPQQNFSIQIPPGMATGQAALSVFHISLVGAGPVPFTEMHNVALNVQ
ncbi:hypothetical protein PENSPDRAFT_687238 [Peniophora sp. CONT]|nr:hypothetical protein PENSPDRAFT_687238 [Peniophora sp. CONT]